MLKYPCLVLDHDDTVVQSEATLNYPFFCKMLDHFRPNETITWAKYISGCFHLGFSEMCRQWYGFTEEELAEEYLAWKEYIRNNIPAPFAGIEKIIHRQKAEGGILCVVSHSGREIITRDYQTHFGILPDDIFGWDFPEHQRKPNPYPLEQIMEKYQLRHDELLVVDDMKPAFDMARAAGVSIAYAAWGRPDCKEVDFLMRNICDFTFNSTRELADFLY